MKVLDHGEVNLIEAWGSDENIIRAARQSTDGAFRGWSHKCEQCDGSGTDIKIDIGPRFPNAGRMCPECQGQGEIKGDERLLRFLYTHNHMTPFEMCGAIFEVKAPIFVFREWHRHRTQSYNEMSGRYIQIPWEDYVPTVERVMKQGGHNKQAGAIADGLTPELAQEFIDLLRTQYVEAQNTYEWALSKGVPKELARLILPVGRYSKMWASANLRNWMQFLALRNAPNAQWEIQEYARAVQALLKEQFPRTIELFEENNG